MTLIAFIIVVAIAIVFLIVFNVAAAKKIKKRSERPMPGSETLQEDPDSEMQSELEVRKAEKEIAAHDESAAIEETTTAGPGAIRTASKDTAYRKALRGFAATEPAAERKVDAKPQSRDGQYREALRAIGKKTE